MKRLFWIGWFVAVPIGVVLAQGIIFNRMMSWGWKPGAPPRVTLPDAYGLALARLGAATNDFHCVTAHCLEFTNGYLRGLIPAPCGWDFSFADTNGQRLNIQVSFDMRVHMDDRSGRILASRDVPIYENCIAMLRAIDGAKNTWVLDRHKTNTDIPTDADLFGPDRYISQKPRCPQGGHYTLGTVEKPPRCSIPGHIL